MGTTARCLPVLVPPLGYVAMIDLEIEMRNAPTQALSATTPSAEVDALDKPLDILVLHRGLC